jgi:methyl-accepting chemotaxis protein
MLHIGGHDGAYPHVGIKTSTPNVDFTVNGEISSNNIIYDRDGNSTQWNSGFTSINKVSANWDSVYTSVKDTSANWDSTFTSVKNTSANWDSVYSSVKDTSANWDSVYSSVLNTSGNWDSVYTTYNKNSSEYTKYEYVNNSFLPLSGGTVTGPVVMLSSLQAGSGNLTLNVKQNEVTVYGTISSNSVVYANNGNSNLWNSVYTSVKDTSGNWNSVYSSVKDTSANWDSVFSSVLNTSANWDSVYSSVLNTSANWDSVYSSVLNTSANWDSVYSSVKDTSANWDSVFSSVLNTSANWDSVYTSVKDTSANWDSVYTSVKDTSGNWNSVYTTVSSNSANWNNSYTTVQAKSATEWNNDLATSYTRTYFLPLSGGNITESLSVDKNVYVSGVISASASNVKINIINDSISRTFTDDDNNKVVHLNTTSCPLCAIFPNNLSSGFNVAIMNIGTNNLILSAADLKSAGTIIITQYGGAFVYKELNDIFAVGRLV